MKAIILGLAASAALVSPAVAADNTNFTGVRLGVTAGADDVTGVRDTTDVVYGADVGVDVGLGDNVVLGAEAFSTNPFDDARTIGAAARLGYAVHPNWLLYTRAGYTNYRDVFSRELDGLTVGGGVEHAISQRAYIKAEYRYSDFDAGVGNHGGLVGVGIRF